MALDHGHSSGVTASPAETGFSYVDNTARISEGGTRISLPAIRPACDPGHRMQFLARVGLNYFALEIPVWYRNP